MQEGPVSMINALRAQAQPPTPSSPVVLMVSGGSDSTALLVRAATGDLDLCDGRGSCRIDPSRLVVLHVNHCLRGSASDGDEEFVRELGERLGIPVRVLRADLPQMLEHGGNMEQTARHVRYEAAWALAQELSAERGVAGIPVRVLRADLPQMLEHGGNMEQTARHVRYEAAWALAQELSAERGVAVETARILVAHTADDRIETFLMRVTEGAGVSGLTGMRSTRGVVVRPLLGETRADLRAYLTERGVGWREDETNGEDVALRSFLRNRVVPALLERNPRLHETLGRTLDIMAEEDRVLEELACRGLESVVRPARGGVLVLDARGVAAMEPPVARRVLRMGLARWLSEGRFRDARFEARHIEGLLDVCRKGSGSCTLPLGLDARMDRGELVVSLSTLAKDLPLTITLPIVPIIGDDLLSGSCTLPLGLDARMDRGELVVSLSTLAKDLPLTITLPIVPIIGDDLLESRMGADERSWAVPWRDSLVRARLIEIPSGVDGVTFARKVSCRRKREEGLLEGRDFVLADADALGIGCGAALEVGGPCTAERVRPLGMAGTRLVSDVLSDAGVPLRDRRWTPVVRTTDPAYRESVDSGVVWVGGIRLDDRAAYRPETRSLVELTIWKSAYGGSGVEPRE